MTQEAIFITNSQAGMGGGEYIGKCRSLTDFQIFTFVIYKKQRNDLSKFKAVQEKHSIHYLVTLTMHCSDFEGKF